ncbi:6941_t:CDS:2 [Dentiscutata erythropus]|uniref:6941_t:CDS:1 n=1 Tax=Dentiscutata erythropus TaxID=1348616 RepID=A0A9N9HMA3_9GLOM|nr:6941_t:CDS:2 [Dentiscutata erythropus]
MTSNSNIVQISIEEMTSNSDIVQIPIEEIPDKNKKILEIVCSPNLKHVAALDEDSNISLWSIISEEKLLTKVKTLHIGEIWTKENGEKIFAVSDNKYVSISLNRVSTYNFKIVDFEAEKDILLTFKDRQKEIDYLSFIDNGDIIMVNTKYYRAYIFTSKDLVSWVCKSMIELKYFKKIYITPKGKLIIFNDTIYEISMWDIEKLSIKTRILIDWNYTLEFIEISGDEELLIVCAKNEETEETRLYTFSTENRMNLAFYTTELVIDRLHLVASKKGERLLYISGEQYNLMDPYYLKNPIDASKLFKRIQIQRLHEPYMINSDKIIYTIDGKVLIENLVPDNWVEYLRKELEDTNSITTPSKKTIDILTGFLKSNYNPDRKEFIGNFLKWRLELDHKSVRLTVTDFNYRRNEWNPDNPDDKKKHLDIFPSFYTDGKRFILYCEVLENDDFITITRIGVIIWTFKFSDIKMLYYWNDCDCRLDKFDIEESKFKDFIEGFEDYRISGRIRILPASNYETICKNLNVRFDLMEALLSSNDGKWIRYLGQRCLDKCVQNDNHMISKISLLDIIFEYFDDLSYYHPTFMANILFRIRFVVPSTILNLDSPHLSSYGRYYHLSKTSSLDILISSFRDFNRNDLESALRPYSPYIQDDEKPYFSQNLREVLQLDDEEQPPKELIKDSKTNK